MWTRPSILCLHCCSLFYILGSLLILPTHYFLCFFVWRMKLEKTKSFLFWSHKHNNKKTRKIIFQRVKVCEEEKKKNNKNTVSLPILPSLRLFDPSSSCPSQFSILTPSFPKLLLLPTSFSPHLNSLPLQPWIEDKGGGGVRTEFKGKGSWGRKII